MTTVATESEREPENIDDLFVAKKLLRLKQSADSRYIHFDLSFSEVKRLLKTKKCFYTGKEFSSSGIYARSIDRVDTTKGYVKGNVVACTVDINQKKANLTNEEIFLICKKIQLHRKKK